MGEATRRGFITMAGVGTAAGIAVVAAPGALAATRPAAEDSTLPPGVDGSMAAYIHDLDTGEVALLVEGRQVIVTDKALVSRLAKAFAKAAAV
jgi:hypothetical protein